MPRRVPRLLLASTFGVACVAPAARAQVLPVPRRADLSEPRVWVSASIAMLQAQDVADGRTDSYWQFGNRMAAQYRASAEVAVSRGTTVGVAGTFARQSLRYYPLLQLIDPPPGTPPGTPRAECDGCYASADVSSLLLTGRAGGGPGLHQVIEVSAGVVQYGGFTRRDGRALPPVRDRDLAGTIGYGAGYSFNRSLQVALVQDFGVALHQKEALPDGAGRVSQQRTTRLSLRYGVGRR